MLELRRLALTNVCPKNTASFVISKMVKDIKERFDDIDTLISYQDTEVHLGTIYKASNWKAAPQQTKIQDWNTDKRKRNKLQSTANKIRWEYQLNETVRNN